MTWSLEKVRKRKDRCFVIFIYKSRFVFLLNFLIIFLCFLTLSKSLRWKEGLSFCFGLIFFLLWFNHRGGTRLFFCENQYILSPAWKVTNFHLFLGAKCSWNLKICAYYSVQKKVYLSFNFMWKKVVHFSYQR